MSCVSESLAVLSDRGVDPQADVYARMFAAHPDTARLFVRDTDGGVRGNMLYQAIEAALDLEGAGAYGANMIGCEVVNHQNLGVTPEVFVSFFATMRDIVRTELGASWTPDMADGWEALLARVDAIVAERCR
jgi:hemoglobin-like flavoprotein